MLANIVANIAYLCSNARTNSDSVSNSNAYRRTIVVTNYFHANHKCPFNATVHIPNHAAQYPPTNCATNCIFTNSHAFIVAHNIGANNKSLAVTIYISPIPFSFGVVANYVTSFFITIQCTNCLAFNLPDAS